MGLLRLLFSATHDPGFDSIFKLYLKKSKTHPLKNYRGSAPTMDHYFLTISEFDHITLA